MFYANAAGRMDGLKYGSCRIWQLTDLPPTFKQIQNSFMRTPRDAYSGAQTCCALKSSAPFGARQDNYADSGSACKLAQDMVPTAHTQIDVRAQPLKNSAGRVPQAADGTCK